ncbi:MAG: RecX family transcriptional regulator [Paludibacteraceae bacterium]|nr:RecX family transcriptional regulator [Paludibacteraceae bacterium]
MENRDLCMERLISRAQAYCATAERCNSEVRLKLLRVWGADNQQADKVIEQLYEQNFLNDGRYAAAFVHDKVAYQGWGRIKIKLMLEQKNIPSSVISAALENIDESVYFANLKKLADQKRKSLGMGLLRLQGKSKDNAAASVYRFLLQRGFTYDEIHRILPES